MCLCDRFDTPPSDASSKELKAALPRLVLAIIAAYEELEKRVTVTEEEYAKMVQEILDLKNDSQAKSTDVQAKMEALDMTIEDLNAQIKSTQSPLDTAKFEAAITDLRSSINSIGGTDSTPTTTTADPTSPSDGTVTGTGEEPAPVEYSTMQM